MGNDFSLEINLTKNCNFRCTYCYEQDNVDECFKDDKPEFKFEELVAFIDRFSKSEYVKQNHDGKVKLTFWGGEPLMRYQLIKRLVEHYIDDDGISYFLYTNGYFVEEILTLAKMTKKFNFQISYDGHEIHRRNRKLINQTDTIDIVFENIKRVSKELGRAISMKPTIPMSSDFKYLVDSYKDYLKMFYWYRDEMGFNVSQMKYKPTPTWAHKASSPDEHLEDVEMYEAAIEEVAKLDQLFQKAHGRSFFEWFKNSLSICGAGRGLAIIDRDYKVYSCHNFLYYDENEITGHILFDPIRDNDDMDVLFRNLSMFNNCSLCKNSKPTKKCQECEVDYCMRCNTAIFMSSDNPDFLKRWTDMGAQNTICELFKANHRVVEKYFK